VAAVNAWLPVLTELAGVGLGAIIGWLRERAYWRREAVRVFTRAPLSTAPPTLTALHYPVWASPWVTEPGLNGLIRTAPYKEGDMVSSWATYPLNPVDGHSYE
jgi:hypothetical protein